MKQPEVPTLVVHQERAENNIRRMAKKAKSSGVVLRPHFKTHQSAEIGRWFRKTGIDRITVSSVAMAEYFAADGWKDITIAFPVNLREGKKIDTLSRKVRLGLLTDSPEVTEKLDSLLTGQSDMWIKVDTGYHRSGLPWTATTAITTLAQQIASSRHLSFRGLLTHPGHAYHLKKKSDRIRLFHETAKRLEAVRNTLPPDLMKDCLLSTGDTPTCTAVETLAGIDEVRPGNFLFFDIQQLLLGTCDENDIAAAVVCPVVGVYPSRQEAVIYGGAVHLSKQAEILSDGTAMYGYVVPWEENRWGKINPAHFVREVSQEHGIIHYGGPVPVKPGDLVAVLPVHSCLTMNLLRDRVKILPPIE